MSPAAWRHIHLNDHYTFRATGTLFGQEAGYLPVFKRLMDTCTAMLFSGKRAVDHSEWAS
jgi:hypothetical protein